MFKRVSVLQYTGGGELVCADCSASDPTWASINRGVMVCDECCSIHRSLGRHISHIRSVHSSWPSSQKEMVNTLVLKGANSIWEHALHDSSINLKSKPKKPGPKDKLNPNKHDFIMAKYNHLTYIPRFARDKDDLDSKNDLNRQLHASVRTSNLETCLRLISLGADVNYFHPDKGNAPLHIASQAGQSMQVELLVAHGANPCILDRLGHLADECARIAGHHQLADRLIECQYELSDKLSEYLCNNKPRHSIGEHFLVPKDKPNATASNSVDAINKLKELSNKLFEELSSDVYDELDRRETDTLWLTTQQQQSSVAFLPVNPLFTPLRNQGRQKLATLDIQEFRQLLVDILVDTKRRQSLAMTKTGDQSGTAVPSCDLEMPQHDYDELPVEELPVVSPPKPKIPSGSDKYTALLEKYEERGKEIGGLRKIIHQLEVELKQAKAELEAVRAGKKVRKPSDSGYSAIVDQDEKDYAEVSNLICSPEPEDQSDTNSSIFDKSPPFSPGKEDSDSIPPTSPRVMESVNTGYARVDMAKKTLERKRKAAQETRRKRLESGQDPNKDDINICVKKITKHIYSLVEATKTNQQDKSLLVEKFEENSTGVAQAVSELAMLFPEKPRSSAVQESLRDIVLASRNLRTEVQDTEREMAVYTEQVITSARSVVIAARALDASIETTD